MTSFKERTKSATDDATTDAAKRTDSEKKLTCRDPRDPRRRHAPAAIHGLRRQLRRAARRPFGLEPTSPRGTTYLATARGDLGLARAYIAGDLEVHVHPRPLSAAQRWPTTPVFRCRRRG